MMRPAFELSKAGRFFCPGEREYRGSKANPVIFQNRATDKAFDPHLTQDDRANDWY